MLSCLLLTYRGGVRMWSKRMDELLKQREEERQAQKRLLQAQRNKLQADRPVKKPKG